MNKKRLDLLLTEKGLSGSRQKAQGIIMAGLVRVNGETIDKPGRLVNPLASIHITGNDNPYASRGGIKLHAALRDFGISVHGLTMLDVGASTGGFTSCLLEHGAKRVIAVDVGYGQIAWSLRKDPRVLLIERTNIRYLTKESVNEVIDGAVIDVSFISLRIVVPATLKLLKNDSFIIALIKPQFEAGKGMVGKGGIIRDEAVQTQVVDDLITYFHETGLIVSGKMESPIKGTKGNKEFFVYLRNQ
jgi:23S rRNA (cytidine1920-2'-O)/16S rRNA (cytidine1409-2'-O)-methyltransferase